jgi:hypothetical protein
VHQGDFTLVGRFDDTVTILKERGIGRPERSKDGAACGDFAGFGSMLVGNFIDEAEGGLVSKMHEATDEIIAMR